MSERVFELWVCWSEGHPVADGGAPPDGQHPPVTFAARPLRRSSEQACAVAAVAVANEVRSRRPNADRFEATTTELVIDESTGAVRARRPVSSVEL